MHNLFFELNIYKKSPVNKHHWRANIARPAGDIDLNPGGSGSSATVQPPVIKPGGEILNISSVKQEENKDNEKELEKKDDEKVESKEGEVKEEGSGPQGHAGTAFKSLLLGSQSGDHSDDEFDQHYDYDERDDRSVYRDDSDEEGDYTACSAHDCGYCGKCDY